MKTAFKVILPTILIALWANAALVHHAPLVLSHYFGKRAGNCTLKEAFDAEALSRLQLENFNSINTSSRVIRQDERYSALEYSRW